MSHDDVLGQLRSADPVAGLDLSHLDPCALSALRQGITMTDRDTTGRQRRRIGARGTLIAGLSVALVGGGAAYAEHQQWFGGIGDGLNCQSVWNETAAGVPMVGGPHLTGDALLDCDTYRERAQLPPIGDPVAFDYGGLVYVTPRDQVPEGAEVLGELSATAGAERELRASTRDLVDGGSSHCLTAAEAEAFARAELDRLGLTGWTIATDDVPAPEMVPPGMVCAAIETDAVRRTIDVLPNRTDDWEAAAGPVTSGIRTALRTGILQTCVNVVDALAVAEAALGTQHHWPTTGITDEDASCARVDMEVGGSIQVTIHGPTTARP